MAEITIEELLARYNAGSRDFHGSVLSDIVLGQLEESRIDIEGVNFTGAIFRNILREEWVINTKFINCNFSQSVWEFCEMPAMRGCNLQYALMRGCFFSTKFVDCDFRSSQMIGRYFDRGILVFERCDLTGLITSDGPYVGPRRYIRWVPSPDDIYLNTIDADGIFRSGICCDLPLSIPGFEVPF
jgi:uncharacterized protein YjbI with pentapeptide repeats